MKQAILITAYKDHAHLKRIVDFFDDDFQIYIHIDKKSEIGHSFIDAIGKSNKVKVFKKKYKVNWGGLNHLKAILYLAREALKDEENFYFHLISGQDFPLRSCEDFKFFFQKNKRRNYLDYFKVPYAGWGGNGGLDRLTYFNFYDLFDAKKTNQSKWIAKAQHIQKLIGYRRPLFENKIPLYGGSTWWSLNREAVDHCSTFTKRNKSYLKRFRYTFCSEEFYFQSVLINSDYKKSITGNNLRYIDWQKSAGKRPAVLDLSDFEGLMKSNSFFARKFEYPTSSELIERIEERLKLDVS